MTDTYILIGIVSILNIVCFFIGARVGQKVANNKELNLPNPIKAIKEDIQAYEETKEAIKEQERLDTIAYNIDAYDGTSIGQKEIPR
jgi:hypothetical protein